MGNKIYYEKNKAKVLARMAIYAKKNIVKTRAYKAKYKKEQQRLARELIIQIKQANPCKCGESHTRCLDFHHKQDTTKKSEVSRMISNGYSLETIKAEIDKCDIICSNCHRKLHSNNKIRGNSKLRLLDDLKSSSNCTLCGESHYHCLDFHHLNNKVASISVLSKDKNISLEQFKEELSKCQIVCSNCHRKIHSNLRD